MNVLIEYQYPLFGLAMCSVCIRWVRNFSWEKLSTRAYVSYEDETILKMARFSGPYEIKPSSVQSRRRYTESYDEVLDTTVQKNKN